MAYPVETLPRAHEPDSAELRFVADPLAPETLEILRSIHLWVQAWMAVNWDERDPPVSSLASYRHLWWILQLYLQICKAMRLPHHRAEYQGAYPFDTLCRPTVDEGIRTAVNAVQRRVSIESIRASHGSSLHGYGRPYPTSRLPPLDPDFARDPDHLRDLTPDELRALQCAHLYVQAKLVVGDGRSETIVPICAEPATFEELWWILRCSRHIREHAHDAESLLHAQEYMRLQPPDQPWNAGHMFAALHKDPLQIFPRQLSALLASAERQVSLRVKVDNDLGVLMAHTLRLSRARS